MGVCHPRRSSAVWQEGGDAGLDNDFFVRGNPGIGAAIMGRNMFGPVRESWGSDGWRGGNPRYHHPVFVLTHHPHASIPMQGGTTFHFVTDSKDVRLGGGAATIQ